MLIHCKKEDQEEYFNEICSAYKDKDSKFEEFLNYYKKNWLSKTFVTTPNSSSNELFARTNNACEGFHSKLNSLIPHQRPRASILLGILKDIEYFHRLNLIAYSQGRVLIPKRANARREHPTQMRMRTFI